MLISVINWPLQKILRYVLVLATTFSAGPIAAQMIANSEDKNCVVLVHGLGRSGSSFRLMEDILPAAGYRVVVAVGAWLVDVVGSDRSDHLLLAAPVTLVALEADQICFAWGIGRGWEIWGGQWRQ